MDSHSYRVAIVTKRSDVKEVKSKTGEIELQSPEYVPAGPVRILRFKLSPREPRVAGLATTDPVSAGSPLPTKIETAASSGE